ncbi:type II toxin-antitoxin system PemK/MazF family toxin [Haloarcula salinisoli]|uniref:Type II toxin-antitoxin system PemK/MazF family toxin n=1 Tax=Haloarcula salinisoli TaxID=2487746 RepID=A0A8J7YIW2_9EURY|nr:type II toxin-antitoxin system PemK/MazF family toxin [Halomicroarcula salinisoli]MBX0287050.1 type II toxin-antitoxin system PemK/MazF family toxin [Halomicroarcula salinisoli]MBX0304353.1 type II toxin-antitoxin system PemK/MazF family toxin [Halomicroarcula salinisoli]
MSYEQGEVWWGPAPHKSGPAYRPWVVVSDRTQPFAHTECIGLAMTTQQHESGITVPEDAWVRGGSQKQSYISPWYTATLKHRDLDRQQGTLDSALVATAIEAFHSYTAAADE